MHQKINNLVVLRLCEFLIIETVQHLIKYNASEVLKINTHINSKTWKYMTQAARNSGKSKFKHRSNSESWFRFNDRPSSEFSSLIVVS